MVSDFKHNGLLEPKQNTAYWAVPEDGKWCILPQDHPDVLANLKEVDETRSTDIHGEPSGAFYYRTLNMDGEWCHEFWHPLRPGGDNFGNFIVEYHWHLQGKAFTSVFQSTPKDWKPADAGVLVTIRSVVVTKPVFAWASFRDIQCMLASVMRGDWGHVNEACKESNNLAVKTGGDICGCFAAGRYQAIVCHINPHGDAYLATNSETIERSMLSVARRL